MNSHGKDGFFVTTNLLNVVKSLIPRPFGRTRYQQAEAFDSTNYWEQRYRSGGTSGPGSYNRLARFKADFLNGFIAENGIQSVLEFGSGDGSQLELARYPEYAGIDVSSKAIEICRKKFGHDRSKRFFRAVEMPTDLTADLTLSLDVIYHLVEDRIFETYLNDLFHCARRFVIVYSSNLDEAPKVAHVRHRNFTKWVDQFVPNWRLHSVVKNPYPYNPAQPHDTSPSDFYVFAPPEEEHSQRAK